jgi:beta-1,4-mannosyl-glycoprotein beta-1,4-N-acetylglucosaminyltransferase
MAVYSLFQFYNELDVLEIHLETMSPYVDFFVISEATVTYSGMPKRMYYQENKERYKKFEHKIINQVLDDTPEDYIHLSNSIAKNELHKLALDRVIKSDWWPHEITAFGRNTFHKESLIRAIPDAKPDDIVMVSDMDEIPNPKELEKVLNNYKSGEVYNFKQKNHIFYLNMRNGEPWTGNILTDYNYYRNVAGLPELKMKRRGNFIEDGGWHFSYVGGTEMVKLKLISVDEPDLVKIKGDDEYIKSRIEDCIARGVDFYGRKFGIWKVPIDETYPTYLYENQDKFRHLIRE